MDNKQFIVNQKRDLGAIITEAISFVKRTFRLQLEMFLILVLPIFLISVVNLYLIFGAVDVTTLLDTENFELSQILNLLLAYSGIIISILVFTYTIISIGINYQMNDNRLPPKKMVTDFMKANMFRYLTFLLLVGGFAFVLIMMAFMFLAFIPVIGILFVFGLVFVIIYLYPIYSLLPILYLREGLSINDSVSQTIRLIKGYWWPTFGVLLVTNIIGSLASYILAIPIYVMMMIKSLSSYSDTIVTDDGSGFWMSLLMLVSLLSGILIISYTSSAIILKYYDLKERKDNVSLYEKINKIGTKEESMFENEGEY